MQTISCTWRWVVPIREDPAARSHWCALTDLYHAMPFHAPFTDLYHTMPCRTCPVQRGAKEETEEIR